MQIKRRTDGGCRQRSTLERVKCTRLNGTSIRYYARTRGGGICHVLLSLSDSAYQSKNETALVYSINNNNNYKYKYMYVITTRWRRRRVIIFVLSLSLSLSPSTHFIRIRENLARAHFALLYADNVLLRVFAGISFT